MQQHQFVHWDNAKVAHMRAPEARHNLARHEAKRNGGYARPILRAPVGEPLYARASRSADKFAAAAKPCQDAITMGLGVSLDITCSSGILRATLRPKTSRATLLFQAAIFVAAGLLFLKSLAFPASLYRWIYGALMLGAALEAAYLLTGSESIQVDSSGLTLRRGSLGLQRTSRYQLEQCSNFGLHSQGEDEDRRLEFTYRGGPIPRTITFGKHMSEQQAIDFMTELQHYLPEVADKLWSSKEAFGKHFTSLGLN